MNPRLKALLDQKQALIDEGSTLNAMSEWTDEQKARAEALPGLIAGIDSEIQQVKALDATLASANASLNGAGIRSVAQQVATRVVESNAPAAPQIDARVLSLARPTNLMSLGHSREEASRRAYSNGMWLLATKGNGYAQRWCAENGLDLQAAQHVEGVNEDGGYLVPAEFENDLILLREQYGKFRQFARRSPMSTETKSRPRQTGGLTAYFQSEGVTVTESKGAWDRVGLVAKTLMVLTRVSSQLDDDSIIEMGDHLSKEIAYAFALKEDQCGFIGDGSATYSGIVGVTKRLLNVFDTDGGEGLKLGTGNAWSELTLNDHIAVAAMLPEYADTPNVRWFCHKKYYFDVMLKLALAAGGVTHAEIAAGKKPEFLGYPVVFIQAMASSEANSQVPAVLGDLSLAADFGDRKATTLLMSEHVYFSTNEIGIRGTERFDINVHDVGTSGTAAGPVVGLLTAAS